MFSTKTFILSALAVVALLGFSWGSADAGPVHGRPYYYHHHYRYRPWPYYRPYVVVTPRPVVVSPPPVVVTPPPPPVYVTPAPTTVVPSPVVVQPAPFRPAMPPVVYPPSGY